MNKKTDRIVCQSASVAKTPASAPTRSGKPGRPRDPALNDAILNAAAALLEDVGCGGFTMEGVAARAGIGKQTLYRRWSTRGDLLIDLFYRDLREEPILDRPGQSLEDRLRDFLDLSLQRLYEPWKLDLLRSLAVVAQSDRALRAVLLNRITRPRMEMGRRLLRLAIEEGQVRPELDIDVVLKFMFGAIWFELLFSDDPVTPALRDRLLPELMATVSRQ